MTKINEVGGSEKNGGNEDEKAPPAPSPQEVLKSLTTTIGKSIKKGDETYKSLFPSARIYRVSRDLRELNKSAYTPSLISIGPFHRNDPHLPKDMQHVKKHFADYLLFRLAEGEENPAETKYTKLQCCVKKLKDRLDEARKYYAEEITLEDSEMVEMMVVDGCFILELLYLDHIKKTKNGVESGNSKASNSSSTGGAEKQNAHPIFDIVLTASIVKQDLLLLENQIPFFVLEELFKLTMCHISVEDRLSLDDYIVSYFHNIFMLPQSKNSGSEKKGKKLMYIIFSIYFTIITVGTYQLIKENKKLSGEKTVRASDLEYAGVKFAPSKEDNLFKVRFEEVKDISWWCQRADFEIPPLNIHDRTETFLRNLIALEQCFPMVSRHFTSYAQLMDMLIDSKEDVQVLRKAKVIHNYLGKDKDVADLFNNLCKEVVQVESFCDKVCQKVTSYSEHWWPKCIAYFIRTYLASPWSFIGFCLALVAFGIQIASLVLSILK